MTDKEFHRDAFILGAVIIIALLIWMWLNNAQAVAGQSVAATTPTTAQQSPQYVFDIPGSVSNYGPVTFPSAVYNYPALANPLQIINPGSGNPVSSLTPANCSCGCDGSGGTTTYVLQPPDFSSVYNQLAQSVSSTAQALLNAEYNSLGYSEGVFVSNATPTPFAGGTFG